jgi:protease I
MITLQGLILAFLAAPEGVEQRDLTSTWQAVLEAGGVPRLLSTRAGRVDAFRHLVRADTFTVDAVLGSERDGAPDGCAGLVLPGGMASADFLRLDASAVAFVRACAAAGTPVAATGHAPWLLIEARIAHGRTLTSWPSLRTDLENAGAAWVDEQVHVCTNGPGPLITSRTTADLPLFNEALVEQCAKKRRRTGPWGR